MNCSTTKSRPSLLETLVSRLGLFGIPLWLGVIGVLAVVAIHIATRPEFWPLVIAWIVLDLLFDGATAAAKSLLS